MNNTGRHITLVFLLICFAIAASFNCKNNYTTNPPAIDEDSTFNVLYPFWSSHDNKILFFGNIFGLDGYDLYAVDSSGGVATMLMRDSLAKGSPVLSPDGNKIAYLAAQLGRLLCCAHVWVMNIDGTGARDLTPFFSNWEYLRWSPDSRTIIFDGGIEDSGFVNYQIVAANVETGKLTQLTKGNFGNRDASYLADGKRIACLSGRIRTDYGGKVFLMNPDGTNPVPIDTTRTASADPRPSPTQNKLLFVWGLGGESDAGVYSVNVDSVPVPVERSLFHYVYRGDYINYSQWSPDGNSILYVNGDGKKDLLLMDQEGGNTQRVTTGFNVDLLSYAWSPDSKHLVFNATNDQSERTTTFIYDVDTHSVKRLNIKRK